MIPRARELRLPGALRACLLFARLALSAAALAQSIPATASTPPPLPREFRAAWIATVSNIDWPSRPGLSVAEQKAELRRLLDSAAALRLNALIFQVRPACDALYKSPYEPWSEVLTGKMGQAPAENFDPLQFAVTEAHARGLELHAWFNPYRAAWPGAKTTSPKHISKTHPKLVRTYGKFRWLDPGEPAVQDHTVKVILDVVRRYDIDGVHLDDYFYPYPEAGRDFPDDPSWRRYAASGGKLARADWRRENVNKLVRRLQKEIRAAKSWVTFGISPFGIWRPGFPPQIKGFDAHAGLYADARLWLASGWVDYLAPQLYWPIDQREQSFAALLEWWRGQSPLGVPVWPGGSVFHVGKWPAEEIIRQIRLTRAAAAPGYIAWNLSSLARNADGLQDKLRGQVYQERALVPVNPYDSGPVARPSLSLETTKAGRKIVRWSPPANQAVARWVLQIRSSSGWRTEILPGAARSREFQPGEALEVAVSALSPHRNLSPPSQAFLAER